MQDKTRWFKRKILSLLEIVANREMRDKIFQENRHSSYYHYAKIMETDITGKGDGNNWGILIGAHIMQ